MITLIARKELRGKVLLEFSDQFSITLSKSDPRCYDYDCGEEYSRSALVALKHDLELLAADGKLADKLARGPRSVGQARVDLKKKGFQKSVIDIIVERFTKAGYLDDRRFAQDTVNYLLSNNPAGRAYLRSVLLKKLVNSDLAEEVINECFAEVDEAVLAEQILSKKWWRLRELTLETARQKAYTQLARKSIGYAACKQAFDKLAADETSFRAEESEITEAEFET